MTFRAAALQMISLSWLAVVLLVPTGLRADAELTADVRPNAIYEGETFELSFTLSAADWGEFELPDLSGFQLVSGPARSFRTTVVNGRMKQKITHTYRLRAPVSGTFVIGEARMFAGGQIFTSSPLQLLVLERDESLPVDRDFFVQARISCDTCYAGQQIALDLVLYTQKRIADYAIMSEPSLTGFHSRRFRNIRNFTTERDTLDGRLYNKRILRRYILFPQYGGQFGGEQFDLRIVEEDEDSRWRGFFRMRGEVHYTAASIPEFTVLNTPPNAPEDFNGHIGDYEISVVHRNDRVRPGELIPVSVIVRGDGDIASMQPPQFNLSDGLVLSDLRLEREDLTELEGRLRATREWSVLFRADTSGIASITPYLIAYNTGAGTFERIDGQKIEAFVEERDQRAGIRPGDGVEEQDAIAGEDATGIPYWAIYTGLPLILAVAFLWLIFYRQKVGQSSEVSPEESLISSVKAAGETGQNEGREYASKILHALDQYIFKLTEIPMSEWEDERLETQLTEKLRPDRANAALKLRRRLIAAAFGYQSIAAEEVSDLLYIITSTSQE